MTVVHEAPGPHFFTKPLAMFNGKIPFIISDTLKRIEDLDGAKLEGLFRTNTKKSEVENACRELDRNRIDMDQFKNEEGVNPFENAHFPANILRKYLRELSVVDPLIGLDIRDEIITIMQSAKDDITIQKSLSKLLRNSPETRRNSLALIMRYFNRMQAPEDVALSKMNPYNLSVVFTPSLFPMTDSIASGSAMKAVEFMITNYDKIFAKAWCDDSVFMTPMDIELLSEPMIDIEDAKIENLKRQIRKGSRIPTVREDLCEICGISRPTRPPPPLPGTEPLQKAEE